MIEKQHINLTDNHYMSNAERDVTTAGDTKDLQVSFLKIFLTAYLI